MITLIQEPVIWFSYNGDEVCWNGTDYISLLSGGAFSSLDDVDEFWKDYERDFNRTSMNQVTREMAIDAGDPSLEGQWI